MSSSPNEESHFWEVLQISRLPLSFLLSEKKRRRRTQLREFSDAAFVHRMFDLFFPMQQDWVIDQLTTEEKRACCAFTTAWDSLRWKPLETHPHISEVSDADLKTLIASARELDRRLELRTGDTLIPVIYRLFKGWK